MGRPKKIEIPEDEMIRDEVKFYDTLNSFADVLYRINEQASDGETKKNIEKKMCRLIPAFTLLCGVSLDDVPKKSSKKVQPVEVLEPPKKEPEQLPSNFIKEDNGWGLCPVCRKKIIKLTSTTKLIDFPAYCKSCKAEYIVSWWNVESKDIEYTRYVNNTHYVDRRNIRNDGMKGTGVKHFMNTRTSATERVAMKL